MLTKYYLVALCLFVSKTNCEDDYFPPYIQPCDMNSDKITECIKNQIETSLPKFSEGIEEYNVPPLDPMNLEDIIIDGNGLKLKFTKAVMHGLKNSKVTDLKLKIGQKDQDFILGFKTDFSLTAHYNADGKILIVPITGDGDALIKASNVNVIIESKLTYVKNNKGEHLKLITPTYKYDIEKTTFDLKNLFNGNQQLAETTLKFANENWKQLMDELAPSAIKQIVTTAVKAINKFFEHLTIQQLVIGYKGQA